MVLVSEEVKCAVCKSIFCCLECRNRHELNAHNANDVWTERNRMRCGFCQGCSTMEFKDRNDFGLIMHLCAKHLPLHCKKCLMQFNSIGDFSAATNKCAHMNDVCSLQSPKECDNKKDVSFANIKDVSEANYITAIEKSSFEQSISDDYSTILQTSNHPCSNPMEKALVRQTSTPMLHNLEANNPSGPSSQSCRISKKRTNIHRTDADGDNCYTKHEIQLPNNTKSASSQSSGSKIWSFVSTFFRFASFTPSTELSMPNKSHQIIKRCASFNGILREEDPTAALEDNELDTLQPIKRRRITSMDPSSESAEENYSKRIMCRPPIRKM